MFGGCRTQINKLELRSLGRGDNYTFDINAENIIAGGHCLTFESEQSLSVISDALEKDAELETRLYNNFLLVSRTIPDETKDYYMILYLQESDFYKLTFPAIYVSNNEEGPLFFLFPIHLLDLSTAYYKDKDLFELKDEYSTSATIDDFRMFYQESGSFHLEASNNGFIVTPNDKLGEWHHISDSIAFDFSVSGAVSVSFLGK